MKKHLLIFPLFLALVGCGGSNSSKDNASDEGDFPPQDVTAEMEAYYKENSDFFSFKTIDDLPKDLEWTNNDHLREIGSPKAKKGGTFRARLQDFPRTLRIVGPDSNGSFRGMMLTDVVTFFAHRHPDTLEHFPGLAKEWSVDRKNKTVYVRIDPKAKWSDGVSITSDDVLFMFFLMQSKHIQAPWYNNWYTTMYTNATKYDDLTFSVSVPEARPDMDAHVLELKPMPAHFYKELGEDFPQRYQWRFQPTTAAYIIKPEDVKKGQSITLTRNEDWWAKDKKHWRYRYNYDRVECRVIRDAAKAIEEFKAGKLDRISMNLADTWYNKISNDDPLVKNGYIHKTSFYNQRPRATLGLWINASKPLLDNQDIRQGIHYAMNWDRVLEKYFRGDYIRMRTGIDGFSGFQHPTIEARPFDIDKALESFAKAGFTERGPDGYLRNSQGEKLSFSLTTGYKRFEDMLAILKQEARKAGLEIKLDVLDATSGWKKAQEKKHDIMFSGFGVFVELYPRYWDNWHTDTAYDVDEDGKKTVKPQTNNLTTTSIPELDELIMKYRKSEDLDEMVTLSHTMEEILFEYATFIPGYVQPFYRTGYWRWIEYPDDFDVKISDGNNTTWEPWFLSWIDEEKKRETLEGKKSGKKFEPSISVFDQHKED